VFEPEMVDIYRNFVYTSDIMNYSTVQLNRTIMTHQLLSVGMPEYVNPVSQTGELRCILNI